MLNPQYFWFEEQGHTMCIIDDGEGNLFKGTAQCHEKDEKFKSERIGEYIAESRALIEMYKYKLHNEAIPAYKALKHLKNSMEQSYRYNPKSFEARVMKKEYFYAKEVVEMYRIALKNTKNELAKYLDKRKEYQEKNS